MRRSPRTSGARWTALAVAVASATVTGLASAPAASSPAASSGTVSTSAHAAPVSATVRGPVRDRFSGSAGKHGPAVSLNWAGWVVTGPSITTVSGHWTQPTATCTGKATESAFWVGIDGFAATDPTVEQVGTDADCTKKVHKVPAGPLHYAWYEMYPGPLVPLSTKLYPVAPGDQLSASVTQVGTSSSYQLAIADAGRWTYSTVQTASTVPLDASAEWIAEAPIACKATRCAPVPLTDFGTVSFTGTSVEDLAITASGLTSNLIDMAKNTKGKVLKASTSALTPPDDGFDVTWVRS